MTNRASELTVRQTSPWILPSRVYVAVLLGIGFLVFGANRIRSDSSGEKNRLDSKAFVSVRTAEAPKDLALKSVDRSADVLSLGPPRWNIERIREQVVSQAEESIRPDLRIETIADGPIGDERISIGLTGESTPDSVRAVNALAEKYAQALRDQWRSQVEQISTSAEDAIRTSELGLQTAKSQLEAYNTRHRQNAEAEAEAKIPAQPPMIDNPRWIALDHRLEDLRLQRTQLLIVRTAIHPAVQALDVRIDEARHELDSVPAKIAGESPPIRAANPLGSMLAGLLDPAELQRLQEAVTQQTRVQQRALQSRQEVAKLRGREPKIDLQLARYHTSTSSARSIALSVIGASAVGLTSVTGLGIVTMGAAIEPALTSSAQLAAAIGVPVVGILPATTFTTDVKRSKPRQRLRRFMLISCGMLVLCGCFAAFLRVLVG